MSKCTKTVELSKIKSIEIYKNTSKLTFQQIVEAKRPNIAINGAYFNGLWQAEGHVKANGVVLSSETWGTWGYAWNTGSDIQMAQIPCDKQNYISCLDLVNPWDGADAPLIYDEKNIGGNRGRTAIGVGDNGLTILSIGDRTSDATTPEGVRDILLSAGCKTALELDSGSSSHSYIDGKYILSDRLVVQTVVLIYLNEDEPKVPETKTLYRVQCGAFSKKENAENLLVQLKGAGFTGFVTEVQI